MKKLKKQLRKKINPEKSNKMIYAVAAGLIILFAAIFFLSTGGETPENKKAVMESILAYLKKTEGISNLVLDTETNKVKLYYVQDSREAKKIDYKRITKFAGIKLSNKLKDEKFSFQLIDYKKKDLQLTMIFQNGKVIKKLLNK